MSRTHLRWLALVALCGGLVMGLWALQAAWLTAANPQHAELFQSRFAWRLLVGLGLMAASLASYLCSRRLSQKDWNQRGR